jgi:hydrophobic/amphiphilic exporter-1 (mainly G- bacteria), HAE1 family
MQKLAELCVRRPVFATMLILTLVVLGIFSYQRLEVERFPRVEFPSIIVTTVLPGAAPQEVETEITDKIEEALNTISGIEELRSTSSEGVSVVIVQFDLARDLDGAAQDVRDKLNLALPLLPKDIEQPVVQKLDPDAAAIMTISVASNRSVREMTEYADKVLRRQLESVDGVGQVVIVGGRKRQINIFLDGDKLRAYNLTVAQVSAALQTQNIEVPGGRVEEGARTLTLRTLGRVQRAADFNDLVIASRNGYPIKISDVGHTEDGVEVAETGGLLNDKPALLLNIRRQSGKNTVDIIDNIKARLATLNKALPPGYSLQVVRDQSTFILASFHTVKEHLILGSLLASLVVFLFMRNLRATIISAIAIPTSIISTFAVMEYLGITLNGPAMLGLTLSVGIVIDDAIVVLENIFRYIEEKGYSAFDAAIQGTREIGLAVMATTLSLVVIFLPVGFMQSVAGRFFKSVAFTMAAAITISLLVSFTLTPMLSARMFKGMKGGQGAHSKSKETWLAQLLDRNYARLINWTLHHRVIVIVIALLTLASPVLLIRYVGSSFFPYDDQSEFDVSVRAPEGTSLQGTLDIAKRVSEEIRKLPHIAYTITTVGDNQQKEQNLAKVYVKLTALEERKLTQFDLMTKVREEVMPKFAALNLRSYVSVVAAIGGSSSQNAEVNYELRGPDLNKLNENAAILTQKLKAIKGVADADSSLILGKPELRVQLDRQKAAELGVNVADVAQSLRLLVGGDKITTYNESGEQYEVHVRAAEGFRKDVAGINQLNVPSSRLGSVGLDNLVKLDESSGPTLIQRTNRQRSVTLYAFLKPGTAQSGVSAQFETAAKALKLPPDYVFARGGNSREQQRTGRGFLLAFTLSFVFMYIVLAAQFESFIHPVTVLLSLPLTLPFALLSLILANQIITMFTLLGILVLFGMVKKNSILQIDHTNQLIAKGMERHEALIQASRDRLRPILMTTIAFVAGMAPLAISNGPGSGVNRSTSVVIIGGQSLCLLLTLVMTPVTYSLFDDAKNSTVWSRLTGFFGGMIAGTRQKAAEAVSSLFSSLSK